MIMDVQSKVDGPKNGLSVGRIEVIVLPFLTFYGEKGHRLEPPSFVAWPGLLVWLSKAVKARRRYQECPYHTYIGKFKYY